MAVKTNDLLQTATNTPSEFSRIMLSVVKIH